MLQIESEIPIRLEHGGNPFLRGAFAPVSREITATDLQVSGEIPRDLDGIYLRNGPNPVFAPRGRYHWFDGDGMVHAVEFHDGKAVYRNRWVRTAGFRAEQEAQRAIWPGLMDPPDANVPHGAGADGWLKDTANTDVIFHNGYVLALWYQCGLPYKLEPRTLKTRGVAEFGRLRRTVSAHAKVDPLSDELLFFDYATRPPFMTYGVVGADGRLKHHTAITLPGPRLPHDMAVTENYSVLMDLPLFWDPALLARNVHKVTYYPEMPSRFGIVPRYGSDADVRWFESSPCYIYHVINAWEEGEELIMDACRVLEPAPPSSRADGQLARMRAFLRLEAKICRWRFDLKAGSVKEEQLDDSGTEWPSVNRGLVGRRSRYSYSSLVPNYEGLVKYDHQRRRAERYLFGAGRTANEAPFAPRCGAADEDDGYLVTFVNDSAAPDSGEVIVLNARDLGEGPLARIRIPQRVPNGFHATWVPGESLRR